MVLIQKRMRVSFAAEPGARICMQGSHRVRQHGAGLRLDVHVAARVGRGVEDLVGQAEGLGDLGVAAGLQRAQLNEYLPSG